MAIVKKTTCSLGQYRFGHIDFKFESKARQHDGIGSSLKNACNFMALRASFQRGFKEEGTIVACAFQPIHQALVYMIQDAAVADTSVVDSTVEFP